MRVMAAARVLALSVLVLAVLGSVRLAHAEDDAALLQALRAGGVAVLVRHAQTVPGAGDPPGFRFEDCATQRNLSEPGRAQAQRFGAEILSAQDVIAIRRHDPYRIVVLSDNTEVATQAVLIASGMQVRQLEAPGVTDLVGMGVYYGAALSEAATYRDKQIYVVGGGPEWPVPTAATEMYNPATDSWATMADMPTERTGVWAAALNGRIYVLGGLGWENEAVATAEEFDPARNSWRRVADMPTARFLLAAETVGGKVYAIGGAATRIHPHP